MKNIFITIAFLFLLILCTHAANVAVDAHHNVGGEVDWYEVTTQNGPDLSSITTKYTIQEFQDKFGALFKKSESGTSADPSRIRLEFKEDGTLIRAVFQTTAKHTYAFDIDGKTVIPTGTIGSFEQKVKSGEECTDGFKEHVQDLKTDVETKTGKTIDGKVVSP